MRSLKQKGLLLYYTLKVLERDGIPHAVKRPFVRKDASFFSPFILHQHTNSPPLNFMTAAIQWAILFAPGDEARDSWPVAGGQFPCATHQGAYSPVASGWWLVASGQRLAVEGQLLAVASDDESCQHNALHNAQRTQRGASSGQTTRHLRLVEIKSDLKIRTMAQPPYPIYLIFQGQ